MKLEREKMRVRQVSYWVLCQYLCFIYVERKKVKIKVGGNFFNRSLFKKYVLC